AGSRWFRSLRREVETLERGAAVITRRRGGRRIAVEVRASMAGAGTLLLIFRDCTGPLNARRVRALGERRLRYFLDSLPEPLVIEQDRRIAYANTAAARLLGEADARRLAGQPIGRMVPELVQRRIEEQLASEPASGTREPVDATIQRQDGSTSAVQVSALPIMYRRRPACQLLLRDVTAERQVEAGLRATHERLRFITDVVREYAILTLDGSGAIVSWNAGAERLTGYAAADAVRRPFSHLHAVPLDLIGMLDIARETSRHEFECTLRRADGAEFRAHVTVTALQDPQLRAVGYAVILRDLTERLRAEENLRRSEEQLRHAQKMDAVGRLAAGIAHDFNNVLTAIQGHVEFMLEDLPADLPSRDDAVEIRRAADRATELTRQLLTFARRQPSQPVALDLGAVVRDVEKLLRRLIRADIRLDTALHPGAPVFADPGQMEQVIVNLVVNARDAIQGGGSILVSVTPIHLDENFRARGINLQPGDYIQLAVTDTGIGMSADVQRQIFEPFFTTKVEGTGLGLATVYGIVQQSHGHVAVYSELGAGTTIKVFLPVHGAMPPALAGAALAGPYTGTVLLVEDDDAVRVLAQRTLVGAGFMVFAANGAEDALAKASAVDRVDVIVTDLMMPGLTGDALALQVRALHPAAGLVLMSGFSQDSLVREGRIEPQRHFLEKPFTPAALTRMVRDALRG
ncbi:MAG TPA: PAS domain S-box protein, partial [Longimicrobiales bacterium]|nr:PAS domain S-box protein [Longimicrobiales bacterium]